MWLRNLPLLLGVLCGAVATQTLAQPVVTEPNWQVQTFRSSFPYLPTGMAFLGPNDCLIVQKNDGRVYRSTTSSTSVAPTLVLDLPVNSDSERGLLDIALHPNFGKSGQADNDKVYLYYSRNSTANDSDVDGVWLENRLSRFTWDGSALVNEVVLTTFGTNADGAQGPNHNGGPMTFGPDGKLYGITGDLNRNGAEQNFENEENNSSFVGGVYRLNDDGTVPVDNPFASHTNADFHRWYAYGIRNSFGLAFDPATGNLWDTENGPGSYDEVNFVAPGFNSGWSQIMGPDIRDPQGVGNLVNLAPSGVSTYSDPEFSWLGTVAPTAIHFLHGSALGAAYDDKVLVADNNNGQIYMFTLNAARDGFVLSGGLADLVADSSAERNQLRVGSGFGVVTDLIRGPDGYVYAVSLTEGAVYRIFRSTGDYNNNGVVDAADYSVWRDSFGQEALGIDALFFAANHSGPTPGVPDVVVDQFDYEFWKARFGEPAGAASLGLGAVPEPPALPLLMLAAAGVCGGLRRTG